MSEPLRAAAVQLTATADRDHNLQSADRLVRDAAGRGARLVVLPEKWTAYGEAETLRAAGESIVDGPAMRWAMAIAAELEIDLVAGSIVVAPQPGARERRNDNTMPHIAPDGRCKALYRKIHMFDVSVGGREYRESDTDRPGDRIVTSAMTHDGEQVGLGLAICYDLRYPELFRIQAVRGARILCLGAAFTETTTREHWEPLVRARAIENQAFMIAANQVGSHAPNLRSGGRTMIVDPWGVVLAQARDAECVIVADLDLDQLGRIRARLPSLAGRRPETYS